MSPTGSAPAGRHSATTSRRPGPASVGPRNSWMVAYMAVLLGGADFRGPAGETIRRAGGGNIRGSTQPRYADPVRSPKRVRAPSVDRDTAPGGDRDDGSRRRPVRGPRRR